MDAIGSGSASIVLAHDRRVHAVTYGWSTITIFRVPHFVERGLDPTLVAFAIAADAIVTIVVSVSLGRLSERVAPRYILVLGVGGLLVSAGSLIVVDNVALLFVANFGYADLAYR